VTADNIELSAAVLELLLIIGISSGSYSKIRNNYNSHTNYNSNISSYTVKNHIHKLTNIINIDISIYKLRHTSSCIIYISSSVVQHT
jgi:hypothetical protein